MKCISVFLMMIPILSIAYEFTASDPHAAKLTHGIIHQDIPVKKIYEESTQTDATILTTQPLLDIKIDTNTEDHSDHGADAQDQAEALRKRDVGSVIPEDLNLPELPSTNSLSYNS